MSQCLVCYGELPEGLVDYHPACSRNLFGTDTPPKLDFDRGSISELATEVIRSQTTMTGVQPKLSLDIDRGEKGVPDRFTVVGLWGRYILKPQSDTFRHLPELEDVTMYLAEITRIDVVPHGLIRMADGELSYITRRIDRTNKGQKLPMEDFCQISNKLTEHKYKGSHEQIAKLLSDYSSRPTFDMLSYWEVVLFSWLVGNFDMHLKNFSLYRPKRSAGYQLTPAYDLLSTKLVIPEDKEEYVIMRGDVEFRFLELELYYFADNHQDWRVKNKNKDDKMHPFVYERDCEQTGSFFLHQSGVDICFAGKVTDKVDDSCGGGILIRSLLRIEDDKESIVTGPWDCAEALFQYMTEDTVPILHYRKGHLCSEEDIHPTKRCNTNSSIDENEDLCFYDKRYVSNGVWSDLNHIKLERYNPIKRQYVTNRYNNKPWNYGA